MIRSGAGTSPGARAGDFLIRTMRSGHIVRSSSQRSKSMVRKSLLAAAMIMGLSGAANVASAQPTEIDFGIISTESSSNLKKIWDPFLADMAKKTGLKVKAFFASDYAGVIEAMRFKKVQIAWFGNKSAMEAVDRADGEIFAQTRRQGRQPRLLVAHHRAQGQPVPEARRRAQVRQDASTSASAIRTRPRASWCRRRSCSRPATSTRRTASRPFAPPTTRRTPWPSPTSWCTPPPTTTRTSSA